MSIQPKIRTKTQDQSRIRSIQLETQLMTFPQKVQKWFIQKFFLLQPSYLDQQKKQNFTNHNIPQTSQIYKTPIYLLFDLLSKNMHKLSPQNQQILQGYLNFSKIQQIMTIIPISGYFTFFTWGVFQKWFRLTYRSQNFLIAAFSSVIMIEQLRYRRKIYVAKFAIEKEPILMEEILSIHSLA